MKKLAYIILLLLPFITTCNKWYDDYDNLETVLTNGVWVIKKEDIYFTISDVNETKTRVYSYKEKDYKDIYFIFDSKYNLLFEISPTDDTEPDSIWLKVSDGNYAKIDGKIYYCYTLDNLIWFKMLLFQDYCDGEKKRYFFWKLIDNNLYIKYKTKCVLDTQYFFFSEDTLMWEYSNLYTKPYLKWEVQKYSDKYLYLQTIDTVFYKDKIRKYIYKVDLILKNVKKQFNNVEIHINPENTVDF